MDESFNRSQLVALVQRLLQMDYHNEEEADQMIMEVQRHVLDPQVIDYIFWTDEGITAEKAAEEIVDRALAYQPIIATWSLDQ